jgi:hypothetical protein
MAKSSLWVKCKAWGWSFDAGIIDEVISFNADSTASIWSSLPASLLIIGAALSSADLYLDISVVLSDIVRFHNLRSTLSWTWAIQGVNYHAQSILCNGWSGWSANEGDVVLSLAEFVVDLVS